MATTLLHWDISQVKQQLGIDTIQVVRNPHTDKLFVSTAKGSFRCQGDLDITKPMHFIGESLNEACLVNIGRGESGKNTLLIL